MENFQEPRSLGWNAINGALRPIYRDTEPIHWGTILSWESRKSLPELSGLTVVIERTTITDSDANVVKTVG